jgi:hypothetical protein
MMRGKTHAGGVVIVYTENDAVLVGATSEERIECIPLSFQEARKMANWLNGAADEVEKSINEKLK